MAPKSSKRILKNALKKLTDEEFKDFIEELLDRKDGVVKHLVLGKDRMDVANVMTTHYTEDNVVSVTIEIFKEMSLHQQVKELAEEAQNAGVGLSAPAPVVTAEIIHQLLDDLELDGVLSDEEKDAVVQKNATKPDKAGELTKLIDKVYPVTETSYNSRVALLITNIKFSDMTMNRSGAEKDEENMEKLLSSLGYEVVKYQNLTGKGIDGALKKFTEHPKLEQTDSVFVVIMSHGKREKILGVEWKKDNPDEFPVDNIFKHLGSQSCPELIDKPKVIIIQACRGGQIGSVLVSDSPNTVSQHENLVADDIKYVHPEKDFIALLPCTPDTVAFRNPDNGSVLIQHIVEVFHPESYQKHILELFTEIMSHVAKSRNRKELQMAIIDRCTLEKSFYLFQGLLDNSN
ncbi:caspase a [Anableps anableps]